MKKCELFVNNYVRCVQVNVEVKFVSNLFRNERLETNQFMSNDNSLGKSQYLSDLLDDQVSDKAVEHLLSDSDESSREQAETWYRFNLVSAVLNKSHSAHASFDFTQSISAKIADEVVYSLPVSNVVPIRSTWRKNFGGFAMAASVAFAMVFSVQMMNNQSEENLNDGVNVATQAPQTLLPVDTSISAFDFKADQAEQEKLDNIQRMLNQLNRRGLNVTEELVGGEFIVQSFVVKTKQSMTPFEEQIRQMKKPSEINK